MFGVVLVLALFGSGYHSVDLAWNVLGFSYKENLTIFYTYCDSGFNMKCLSYTDMYTSGLKQIIVAIGIGLGLSVMDTMLILIKDKRGPGKSNPSCA